MKRFCHRICRENAAGAVIAQASSRLSFVNTDNQPLKIERHEPANARTGVEPNDFIALYFNKPIDPAKLHKSKGSEPALAKAADEGY